MEKKTKATEETVAPIKSVTLTSGCKFTTKISDCQKVHDYFLKNPATMFQCEVDTGCPRPYVCWYVRSMRQNGDIQIFKYGRCPISGCDGVQYLTTNKSLFKEGIKQPNLFDGLWEQI